MNREPEKQAERSTRLIQVEGVTKRLGVKVVLEAVDLQLEPGEVVGIVGPNGAGKSTFIRILCGLSTPTHGTGQILGLPLGRRDGRIPFIGLMTERPAFIESMSAERNLLLLAGIRRRINHADVHEALRKVGLEGAGSKAVRHYSLGMRQRLSLAQAIMERPSLVILDEPTNGLDPDGIVDMRSLIRHLADEQNMGVLLASHLLREVEAVCDRVILLRQGRVRRVIERESAEAGRTFVLRTASPADAIRANEVSGLIAEQQIDATTLRVSLESTPSTVLKRLLEAGVEVEEWYRERSTLERAYLEVMEEAS